MFKRIKNYYKQLKDSRNDNLDVSHFNDAVAEATEWMPLNTASANFNNFKLVSESPVLLRYRVTLGAKVFATIFMLAGAIFLIAFLVSKSKFSLEDLFPIAICVVFIGVGAGMAYSLSSPKVFDKQYQRYMSGHERKKRIVPFSDIHALQLIRFNIYASDGPDYSNYQLNLVLASGKRINICYYNSLDIARKDMLKISNFMDKKCWDATLNSEYI